MLIAKIVIGILVIALGCWQVYTSRNMFHRVRTSGGPETSPFMALGIWDGFMFGVILLVVGIGILFFNFF